jgi:hypothetical protein
VLSVVQIAIKESVEKRLDFQNSESAKATTVQSKKGSVNF